MSIELKWGHLEKRQTLHLIHWPRVDEWTVQTRDTDGGWKAERRFETLAGAEEYYKILLRSK